MSLINKQVPSKYQDEFSKAGFLFPPDDVNAKEKEEKWWCEAFSKAIYSEHCRQNTGFWDVKGTNTMDYETLRLYGQGNQPVDKYKKDLQHEESTTKPDAGADPNRFNYINISWDNQSCIPKYRDAVIMSFDDYDLNISPFGVDENSMQLRQRIKNTLWEHAKNDFYSEILAEYNIDPRKELPFIPADKFELEMWSTTSLELSHEINFKKVCDRTMEISKWSDVIKKKLYEDWFDLSIGMTETSIDPVSGRPKTNWIDPEWTIFPKSALHDYGDIKWWATVKFVYLKDVRQRLKANNIEFTEEEFLKKLDESISHVTGGLGLSTYLGKQDMSQDSHGQFPYDFIKVPVLHAEYCTWNTEYEIEKKSKNFDGTIKEFRGADYKPQENDRIVSSKKYGYEMWYKCDWLIGTDICYDYGKKDWIKRRYDGKTYPAITIYRINNKSFTASMAPIEDELEIITKKYQIAWRNAHPEGYAVFWDALTEIAFESEGKMHPLDVFQLLMDKGVLIINKQTLNGEIKSIGDVIKELPNNMQNTLNAYVMAFNAGQNKLEQIIGFSDVMVGEAPKTNQLVRTTEISQNQAMKRIKPLYKAYEYMKKTVYQKVIYDVQSIAKYRSKGFSDIFPEFSSNTIQKILIGVDDAGFTYEMRVDQEASDQQKQTLVQTASQMAVQGVITAGDFMQIYGLINIGSVRLASLILDYRRNKAIEQQQKINMENIKANGEQQVNSLKLKTQGDIAIVNAEAQGDAFVQQVIGQIKERLLRIESYLTKTSDEKSVA